jgi:hypothetical protein
VLVGFWLSARLTEKPLFFLKVLVVYKLEEIGFFSGNTG